MAVPTEVWELMNSPAYSDKNDPDYTAVNDKVTQMLSEAYPGNSEYDETGKMITPTALHKAWVWNGGTAENSCDACSANSGKSFSSLDDAPSCPVHPNCNCFIEEQIFNENGTLINSVPIYNNQKVNKNMTDKELIEYIMPSLRGHEGARDYAYLDTKGYVTIGIGLMTRSASEYAALPLIRADGAPATQQEKINDYNAVKLNSDRGNLKLPAKTAEEYAKNHLSRDLQYIKNKCNAAQIDFDTLPNSVREVLLDMQYNMGDNFKPDKWPRFFNAVKNKDWAVAATQCQSSHIQDSRNAWRQGKLNNIK